MRKSIRFDWNLSLDCFARAIVEKAKIHKCRTCFHTRKEIPNLLRAPSEWRKSLKSEEKRRFFLILVLVYTHTHTYPKTHSFRTDIHARALHFLLTRRRRRWNSLPVWIAAAYRDIIESLKNKISMARETDIRSPLLHSRARDPDLHFLGKKRA